MERVLFTVSSVLSAITLYAPFLGAGALAIALHTLITVAKVPRLRLHIPVAVASYLLIFGLWATAWALATRHYFEPASSEIGLPGRFPLSHYLAPSLLGIPPALATIITAIAGTHSYARSLPSSRAARMSIAVLALAAVFAGITVLAIFFPYIMWITG